MKEQDNAALIMEEQDNDLNDQPFDDESTDGEIQPVSRQNRQNIIQSDSESDEDLLIKTKKREQSKVNKKIGDLIRKIRLQHQKKTQENRPTHDDERVPCSSLYKSKYST